MPEPSIGILMLETRFPRIPGDVGNRATWDFPVLYKIVKGATPDSVVRKGARNLLGSFINGAKELEAEGARAVTTSCGFLAIFQREIASAVDVPVFTSSLMQVPLVSSMLKPSQKVGVITIDSGSLTSEHLECAGVDKVPHVVVGTERKEEFSRAILQDEPELDVVKSRKELVETAKTLKSDHPEVGAIVLECTNMPPHGAAVQEEVGLPVFDIVTLANMIYHAVVKRTFSDNSVFGGDGW